MESARNAALSVIADSYPGEGHPTRWPDAPVDPDKRLGSIRERLGLENHHQLLSALAELRNNQQPR